MLPAKPLLKRDVAVVSHDDLDHWHRNFYRKDLVLVPWRIRIPKPFRNLRNILRVYCSQRVGKISLSCVDWWILRNYFRRPPPKPHAFWWLASSHGATVLFIGDMDVEDVETARIFVRYMFNQRRPLHAVLLPSFGGVRGHGSAYARELLESIDNLAHELHGKCGLKVGAMPHPIAADWADYNAVRL